MSSNAQSMLNIQKDFLEPPMFQYYIYNFVSKRRSDCFRILDLTVLNNYFLIENFQRTLFTINFLSNKKTAMILIFFLLGNYESE